MLFCVKLGVQKLENYHSKVRKSAGQTLFGTISAHGASLCPETWRQLFWEVLFPLLENVENEISTADKSKSAESKAFLVHHSRDTKVSWGKF